MQVIQKHNARRGRIWKTKEEFSKDDVTMDQVKSLGVNCSSCRMEDKLNLIKPSCISGRIPRPNEFKFHLRSQKDVPHRLSLTAFRTLSDSQKITYFRDQKCVS